MLQPFLRGSCGRPTTFLFLAGRWFWLLFGGTGVGDFPRLLQKMILVLAFSTDIEWGVGPQKFAAAGGGKYQKLPKRFFQGGKHGKRNTDTIYSTTCMGEGSA